MRFASPCFAAHASVASRMDAVASAATVASSVLAYSPEISAMMAFVSDHRTEAQRALLSANERYLEESSDANAAMSREIGLPFCLAMRDFKLRHYGTCVDRLLPVRYMTYRLGGSFAQRDVIVWTLLEAALRAKRYDLQVRRQVEIYKRCHWQTSTSHTYEDVPQRIYGH